MDDPWEALDIDDSDIPSLLRPCKRLLHPEDSISAATGGGGTEQFLRPCSHRSPPQTLPVQELGRVIPGPAGAVQSAMLQKTRDREKEHFSGSQGIHSDPISTQEYIRRAVENVPEFDVDFGGDPWLSALQFIGTVDGVVPSIPLSSIDQCVNLGKVDKVVAVIKSCTHSVLGGLMVTLKDPTGTIGASVHHKVLSDSQFAPDFAIGSVLILEKVAIFSPVNSVRYLNIMPRNLVKIFKKDKGPPTGIQVHGHAVTYVASGEECLGKDGSPQQLFTPENDMCDEILDGIHHPKDRRGRSDGNHHAEKEGLLSQSLTGSSVCSLKENNAGKEPLNLGQDAEKALLEEIQPEKGSVHEQVFLHDIDSRPKASWPKERLLSDDAANRTMMGHVEQIQEDKRMQKQKQVFTASLPHWTDEQLEELFADQDEDDGSFF